MSFPDTKIHTEAQYLAVKEFVHEMERSIEDPLLLRALVQLLVGKLRPAIDEYEKSVMVQNVNIRRDGNDLLISPGDGEIPAILQSVKLRG